MVLLGMVPVLMQTPPTTSRLSINGDALAEFGALDGGALARGSGTDDDQIVSSASKERLSEAVQAQDKFCCKLAAGIGRPPPALARALKY